MSQNPFSHQPPATFDPYAAPPQPPKTSALAITAFIFSCLFCIPGAALIGLILGIVAMITIGSSQGRTKGRGLAVSAVVIGLIIAVVQIGVLVGAFRFAMRQETQITQPSYAAFTALDSGDVSQIRSLLTPAVSKALSDDDILAFKDAMSTRLGAFKGRSADMDPFGTMKAMDADLVTSLKTSTVKGVFPVPAVIGSTTTMVFFASDSISGPQDFLFGSPTFKGSIVDIGVAVPGKKAFKLSDFKGQGGKPADSASPPAGGNGG